jgi:hypothetical protein
MKLPIIIDIIFRAFLRPTLFELKNVLKLEKRTAQVDSLP